MSVNEQAPTSDLTKALSRLAGNRHSDGVSSIVSADDRNVIINGCYEMMVALRSQPPLHERQGMKVKELVWIASRMSDNSFIAQSGFGDNYVAYLTRDEFWRCVCKDFPSLEAAKAAAQSAYEARILSALEPFANSYPQGANLAAHSKNENGPDHEPSPRAQALEEGDNICARLEGLASWLDGSQHSKWCGRKEVPIHGYSGEGKLVRAAIAAIRALSSQPVADGWLPIETAPKDGTEFLAWPCNTENGVIVVKAYWYVHPSIQAWITDEIDCGDYDFTPTRWRPLPSSPEVSG